MFSWLVGAVLGALIGWLIGCVIGWLLFRRRSAAVNTLLVAHATRPAPFDLEVLQHAQQTLVGEIPMQAVLSERQVQEFRASWAARLMGRSEVEIEAASRWDEMAAAGAFAVPNNLRPLGPIRFGATIAQVEESAADIRAKETLEIFLSDVEKQQLETHGYFEIPSRLFPERAYRIFAEDSTVRVYASGKSIMHICARPVANIPWPDVMLSYKLGLQADERRWLRTANKWNVTCLE